LVPTTNLPGTHPSVLAASPASVVRRRRICRNGKLEMTNFGTLRRLLYPYLNLSRCFRQTGTMSSFLRTAILNNIEDIKSFNVRFESRLILEDSAYDNRHASYGIRNYIVPIGIDRVRSYAIRRPMLIQMAVCCVLAIDATRSQI
jgi:hypothetical protein